MVKRDDMKILIENEIEMQKILADLSLDIKNLTSELSKLVELFKEASKTLSDEKISKDIEKEDMRNMGDNVDTLVDQNKTIAKGLLLMESAMRENLERKRESSF
ncbi:MAG: hypothetical protein KKE23_00725 [Nanoarchaeota archaeon]|nr:hypothetical protein [Nanoarchaeota archaeon]